MATPTFKLTGTAAKGLILTPEQEELVNALPTNVKLGRRKPTTPSKAPKLSAYYNARKMTHPPPSKTDWATKMAASIAQTYGNTQQGDCVIAGKLHLLGLWSANESGPENILLSSDREALSEYHRICGPQDNGCVIEEVLQAMMKGGLSCAGKRQKIDGYAQLDSADATLLKVAVYNEGGVTIGFGIPQAWLNSDTWDVTNSGIVGGHDVPILDYNDEGLIVASWGRLYRMTWRAYADRRFIDERFVQLSPEWYKKGNLSPSGINVTKLRDDLEKFAQGITPEPGGGDHDCPPGTHWDEEEQACVADTHDCPPGTHWDDYEKKCVPDGPEPGPVTGDVELELCIPEIKIKGYIRQEKPERPVK